MSAPRPLSCALALVLAGSCSGAPPAAPSEPAELPRAGFELAGRILGPVSSDDEADIEITLRETNGVAADLNFIRLTCNNRPAQEWGASSFVSQAGTNRIGGGSTFVFRGHYRCPDSGRPRELLADLTDENGFHHQVRAAPYHPGWPGG